MSRLKEILQKAWENREQIAEGFYNAYISQDTEIKAEAERRMSICQKCEYYDVTGTKEIVVVKGQPACLLCGCNSSLMCHSMSSKCSVYKIGLSLRWDSVTNDEQEKAFNEVAYKKQFEKE